MEICHALACPSSFDCSPEPIRRDPGVGDHCSTHGGTIRIGGALLTGEGLSGSRGTASVGGGGPCPVENGAVYTGIVSFSVHGKASGPYPGSFSETGSFKFFVSRELRTARNFTAHFKITSGAKVITGSLAGGSAYVGCAGGRVSGGGFAGPFAYTATINGHKVQGTATGSGNAGLGGVSVSESVTGTYGHVSGKVTDRAISAPLGGICVHAYNSSGAVMDSTQTVSSGAYTLSSVLAGTAEVGFSSGCGASNYLTQYYSAKPSLASADPVTVTASRTTPGINAAMATGGQITGTVTDNATHAPLGGICAQAYDSSGDEVASAQTNSTGTYTISALPTGSYRVAFSTGCGAGDYYVTQYYNDQTTLASANPVAVTDGTTTSGIDAAMVLEGQITGTVTDKVTGAPLAGGCVDIYDSSGSIVDGPGTNASGFYSTTPLPAGSYRVAFGICGARTYATQYYDGKWTLASADPVTVTDGSTTSGIDAAMVVGGQITGKVVDSATGIPIAGICAEAFDSSGTAIALASTNASGDYTISDLGTDSYRVKFFSQACGNQTSYLTQYYDNQATLANADPVAVTVAQTTSGIDAALSPG